MMPEKNDFCCSHNAAIDHINSNRILLTLILNLIIPSVQIAGGIYAHSMALISDATHNFSDFIAVLLTYIAYFVSKKGASVYNTFGYKRFEVLAAMINVAILVGASMIILYEAIGRFVNPEPVSGKLVMWIAGIGVIGNGLSALLLHGDTKHNLNIRGAFLHMMGDLLTSVVVLINGAILIFKPWYWLDPLLSLVIVIFILKNCWSILKDAALIMMNATPKGIDIVKLKESLEQLPDILEIHYLHVWNLSSSSVALSSHVVIKDRLLSKTETIAEKIREELFHNFAIDHVVLQFETEQCGNGTLLCEMSCGGVK